MKSTRGNALNSSDNPSRRSSSEVREQEIRDARERDGKKVARAAEKVVSVRDRIYEYEQKKIEDAAYRKIVREKLKEDMVKGLKGEIAEEIGVPVKDIDTKYRNEIKELHEKSSGKIDFDPRYHVCPSSLSGRKMTEGEKNRFDEVQFRLQSAGKFSSEKISFYIEHMIEYFDVDPYHEVQETSRKKAGETTVNFVRVPNDLPLFSEYGFKMGLTKGDLATLRRQMPRFAQAYEICLEKQEHILVTNMLLNLYGSQASTFTAKNLLNWKNESSVDVTGDFDLGKLVSTVMDMEEEALVKD